MFCEKLDHNQSFKVSEDLYRWESNLESTLEADLFQLRNEYKQYVEEDENNL